MVLKVKEPIAEEYARMREGLVLFTYLHLAADKPLTEELVNRKVTGIAYETVQLPSGGLPLLYPMSEVAGCLAPQVGAHAMLKAQGGRGVLMGGVGGVSNAKVVIIGAGVSGQNAANIALGMGADVTLLDTDLDKLRMSFWRYNNQVHGLASSKLAIEQHVTQADMVIGAVLIPGAAAPKLVSNELVSRMKPGLGARRHRRRPGWLLRGHPPDHALGPDVPGAQLDLLLRGEHARRGAQHLDLRPDQRDHALRRRAGHQGLGAGLPRRPEPRARPQHPCRSVDQQAGRRGGRDRRDQPGRGAGVGAETAPAPATSTSEIARAVRTYLDHLAVERGLAANTLSSYRRDLRRYLEHLDRLGVAHLDDVTEATVSAFLVALREGSAEHPPLGSASAARTVVAVRGFHKFALADGLSGHDPASGVKPPAPAKRLPKALPLGEVEAILEAAGSPGTTLALRDRALLELLYGTGARISEAVGLDVDDLDTVDQTVLLRGKGGKQRIVPVGSYALAAVDAYVVRGRPELVSTGSSTRGGTPALFLNARGGRLSRQSAWAVLVRTAERAGVTRDVSPHTLRHSFATHLLDGGADVRVVQELLGHASVTTTQVYTLVTVESLREVFASAHPRARE